MRGLNEVYSGGLGSYGLTLMVTNFLKVHPLVQSGAIREEDNLGVLLMDFLDLFGRRFNYDSVGITIEEQRLYCGKVRCAHRRDESLDVGLLVSFASLSLSALSFSCRWTGFWKGRHIVGNRSSGRRYEL